ncbi:MAG: hypothetical protein H6811_00975 [Phycisphaeraceae bacterium]|nr:hypothetical protein [Phycisphaeraceae bacterium]
MTPERERRLWRITFLVTGTRGRAMDVLGRVLRSGHNLRGIEDVFLDRLILQQAREALGPDASPIPGADGRGAEDRAQDPADGAGAARSLFAHVHGLRRQLLEAWVLANVEALDDVHIARAMDCSRTAALRFLESAEQALTRSMGPGYTEAVGALRNLSRSLDGRSAVGAARARVSAGRRRRIVRRWLPISIGVLGGLLLLLLLL